MKRNFRLLLQDIVAACRHIEQFVAGTDLDRFEQDEKTSSAVLQKFMIIGEAAKNIPDFIKTKYSSVAWKEIAGMRDRLIHGYFGIDHVLVWDTIKTDIPKLIEAVSQILKDLPGDQTPEPPSR